METTPAPPVQTPIQPPVQSTPPPDSGAEDKTVAILSYCTLLGFIVAIILHQQKKTKLGAFHLRQVLGYVIASIVGGIAVFICCLIIGFVLAFIINVLAVIVVWLIYVGYIFAMLALLIMGLISAIQGQMKPMPIIGAPIQKMLGNVFE